MGEPSDATADAAPVEGQQGEDRSPLPDTSIIKRVAEALDDGPIEAVRSFELVTDDSVDPLPPRRRG